MTAPTEAEVDQTVELVAAALRFAANRVFGASEEAAGILREYADDLVGFSDQHSSLSYLEMVCLVCEEVDCDGDCPLAPLRARL